VLDFDSDQNTSEVTRRYYHRNAMGSVMEITAGLGQNFAGDDEETSGDEDESSGDGDGSGPVVHLGNTVPVFDTWFEPLQGS